MYVCRYLCLPLGLYVCILLGMKIIAIANHKGGVGKTQVCLGLASAMSARGQRGLVVDMDSQFNATTTLTPSGCDYPESGTADVLLGRGRVEEHVITSAWPGIDLLGASNEVANFERETSPGSEFRLRQALHSPRLAQIYDWVVIDCPPAVGRPTLAGLIAADAVVMVTEPAKDANAGIWQLIETTEIVQQCYSSGLAIAGIVINKMPAHGNEARYRAEEARRDFSSYTVFEPALPQRAIIADSRGAGMPIHQMKGAKAKGIASIFDAYLDNLDTKVENQ